MNFVHNQHILSSNEFKTSKTYVKFKYVTEKYWNERTFLEQSKFHMHYSAKLERKKTLESAQVSIS